MANIFDKFLNSMRLYEEDDEFDEDEEFEEEEEEEVAPPRRRAVRQETEEEPVSTYRRPQPEETYERTAAPKAQPKRSNVVNMRSQRSTSTEKAMEVCMFRPKKIDDAREICDTLLSGRAVVINMEGVHVDLAQRIIDFTSGACFSVQGNLQKISKYIFIVSPSSIDLTGDFQQALDGGSNAPADNTTLSLDF